MTRYRNTLITTAAVVALAAPVLTGAAAFATPEEPAAVTWSERTPAEYSAEQQELSSFLNERGIKTTVAEDGSAMFDETNEAGWEAVNEFYDTKYPATQESVDASKKEAAELSAYLTARGIKATVVEADGGLASVEYDLADGVAVAAVEDFAWEKNPLPADVLEASNAEAAKMVEFLVSQGATATLATDRHGVNSVETDWNDQKVQDAAAKFWDKNPGPLVGE